MVNKFNNIILFMSMALLMASCAGLPEVGIEEDTVYDRPMPKVEYEYGLGPGDIVEIVYHYTPKPDTKEYYLGVGDVLKVEFAYHPEVNRTMTVRPDGNIGMPRKGDIPALGLTPHQLQKDITDIFSDDFIDPVVTVTIVQYNRAIDHLKKAITTSARGQSKLTTVRPDGYISFPVINDILAKEKTLPEIREIVTKEYTKLIDNITVTLILKTMKANLVYVLGEVRQADNYLMERPLTLSQVISRAGGFLNTAEKSTVLVISRDEKRRPWGRLVDLDKLFRTGDISQDIMLKQYDIVYVPKSAIARRNLFIKQYINDMIPYNLIGPYELGGTLIDNRPVIR